MGITQMIPDNNNNNHQNPNYNQYHHNHTDGHPNDQHTSSTASHMNATSPISSRSYSDTTKSSFDFSAIQAQLPPNTGPPGTVPVTNGSTSSNTKNLGHVPCKFYRQGICQAGNTCPFSHNLDGALGADKVPCKYFQKGNCKFGLKCALAHFLPDGTRVNSKNFLISHNGNGNGNGNGNINGSNNGNGKQNIRRSSFNNYGLSASSSLKNATIGGSTGIVGSGNSAIGATPPEYENSFISSDYGVSGSSIGATSTSPTNVVNNGNGLQSHNVATFINVGYLKVQQQQQYQNQQQQQQQIQATQQQQQQQQQHQQLHQHNQQHNQHQYQHQHQQYTPQHIQQMQSSDQQPISLSLITQESLARSSSFSRSEFNYQYPSQSSSLQNKPSSFQSGHQNISSSFQNQPANYILATSTNHQNNNNTNTSNQIYHQRLLLMQNLLFGSNSYSGAFATTISNYNNGNSTQTSPFARSNSISLNVNTNNVASSIGDSPPAQYYSANSTIQTTPPGYVSSATTPTSRFSIGSRLPSQSYQTYPQQHSKIFGNYIQDSTTNTINTNDSAIVNNTSAIIDDDDFPLTKTGVMFDNVFFMDNE